MQEQQGGEQEEQAVNGGGSEGRRSLPRAKEVAEGEGLTRLQPLQSLPSNGGSSSPPPHQRG